MIFGPWSQLSKGIRIAILFSKSHDTAKGKSILRRFDVNEKGGPQSIYRFTSVAKLLYLVKELLFEQKHR